MFIGRTKELQALQELFNQKGFSMMVIYGRRRIGKSTLITEFIRDKKAIFYASTKVGKERNLELFTRQVLAVLAPDFLNASFPSLEDIFDFITGKLSEEKLVLVIDELPYWAEKDTALLSVLQKYIDTSWKDKNLMIILCGSALSFMENKVLSEKSPLFGRRSAQIRLETFNYKDAALFVPNYTWEEKAICYGITGGVAKYLSLLDSSKSLDENIKRLFFRTDGYLYDETRNLLTQEFNDISLVNNIIEQIASGANSLNLISEKAKENANTILYSLEKLIEVGLVERKTCITEEKNRKKTQYILKDHMFQFWYEFIPEATSIIEMGHGDLYFDKVVKPQLHFYMGSIFEDMCRYYTLEHGIYGDFGNIITQVGTWWGTETLISSSGERYQQATDIDVVAISELDKTTVVGECKFKNEKIGKDIYDALLRRSHLLSGKYRIIRYLFFSLSGYTAWFDELDDSQVQLLTLEDLYK